MKTLRATAALILLLAATGCTESAAHRTPILETSVSAAPSVSEISPSSSSGSPRPDSSRPSASPAPTGDLGGFAEGTQPSQGPLVFFQVIDWVGSAEISESKATFHLTEHCSYLFGPPEKPVLLVWPKGQAWVDPASPSTMHFREPMSGQVRHLTDGQTVNLGGYEITGHGYTYEPQPHGSCPTGGDHLAVQEVR